MRDNTTASDPGQPRGELAIRTLAMPGNTNPNGDIFGGWVVSHMDLAGLSMAQKAGACRAVTVAIDSMVFLSPVHVGDFICCYGEVLSVGRSSVRIHIETWAVSGEHGDEPRRKVTEGVFTFVAIDQDGRPEVIKK